MTDEIDIAIADGLIFSGITKAREEKGLSLDDISSELKVPKRKLLQLESGILTDLGDVYIARALIISVCRRLNLDSLPYLEYIPALYNANLAIKTRMHSSEFVTKHEQKRSIWDDKKISLRIIIVAVLIIAAFILAFAPIISDYMRIHFHMNSEKHSAATASTTQPARHHEYITHAIKPIVQNTHDAIKTPIPSPNVSIEAKTIELPLLHLATDNPASPNEKLIEPTFPVNKIQPNSLVPANSPVIVAEPMTSVESNVLFFASKNDVWVSVRNHHGRVLYRALQSAHSTKEVSASIADFPLSVTLGRTDGVTVLLHGKPLPFMPNEKSGRTVTFTVNR
jgi:cytoskeletal protein RodZ